MNQNHVERLRQVVEQKLGGCPEMFLASGAVLNALKRPGDKREWDPAKTYYVTGDTIAEVASN